MAENAFQQNAFQQDTFQHYVISAATYRDRARAEPVYLVEITLKNSGPTLYFSDRNILINAQQYENYIQDITGISGDVSRTDSTISNANIAITFKNDKYASYDYLVEIGDIYPFEGATCIIKEVYLDDDNPSDIVTIFKGVIDEPQEIDLLNFQCKVSSMMFQKDKQWAVAIVDTTTYPYAYEDVGKLEPFVYGSDILVPALKIDFGEKTTLHVFITATSTTTVELSDASRFPTSGSIYIDEECISYTGKDGTNPNLLTGVTRGTVGTTATIHDIGAEVWENKTQYDSLLASHECYAINAVYAKVGDWLFRTTDVDDIIVGGKQYLRATNQVRVNIADSIEVQGNLHAHATTSITTTTLYMEAEDTDSVSNMGDTNAGNVIDNNLSTYTTIYAINPLAAASGNHEVWRTSDWSIGGASIIEVRLYFKAMRQSSRIDFSITWNGASISSGSYPVNTITTIMSVATGIGPAEWTKLKDVIHNGIYIHTGPACELHEYEIWLEVDTGTPTQPGGEGIVKAGGIVSTRSVERFYANVDGYKDPDGNYGGIGTVVARPDYIIKHFLVQKLGFSLSTDIDTASFTAAGALYDTYSYAFAFNVYDTIIPSDFLSRLAFECRSTLRYIAGKWYLNVIPDTAPAVIKTITAAELAGHFTKFKFNKTPIVDLQNNLTATFKRDYTGLVANNSDWLLTSKTSDTTSEGKYGTYPATLEFEFIRSQTIADSVLEHILLERMNPLLLITFPIFWEHFDLVEGDTFDIDNLLYSGKIFYIEKFSRIDQFRAEVQGREWWV